MKKTKNMIIVIVAIFAIIVIAGIFLTRDVNKTASEKNTTTAKNLISKYLKTIDVSEADEVKSSNLSIGTTTSLSEELPDIDEYPLVVESDADITIEIFSSPEKAGDGTDGVLKELAEKFNNENYEYDGQSIGVEIRNIASGTGGDYLVSGKYVPDAYTPSNEIWGNMIISQNVNLELVNNDLFKNTAGILISQNVYNNLAAKYGNVDLATIVQATIDNEISMGYTNPYASSTGMNFLISTLETFDSSNILSSTATAQFQKFQENVPFVSYTTIQMRTAADTGSLDAFVLEYQLYANDSTLNRDYLFIPFGYEHNNPIYKVGDIGEEKEYVLDEFINYCKSSSSQALAKQYGFNNTLGYTNTNEIPDGNTLRQAQDLWKKEKDVSKPIIAVFVTDVSGSMAGNKLSRLKSSLINSMQYINSNNYIGLVSYSDDVTINVPIRQFSINQKSYFSGAIESLSAGGNTATNDAIIVAANMLLEKQEEVSDAKLMMFVLSDGEQNVGHSFTEAENVIKNLNIPIYTIGYDAKLSELEKLSLINEAASINADSDDVIYQMKNLFNSSL